MAKIIVSLVSEQTLPNYLFIKEFSKDTDLFLFISTAFMEEQKKTEHIYKTLGILKTKIRKILIREDQLFLVKTKLDKLGWKDQNHTYLVNLTGGTKLMAISVYEYFKDLDSRFFYFPYGKNVFKELFSDKEAIETQVSNRVSIESYFLLLGIKFESKQPLLTKEQCFDIFEKFSLNGFYLDAFPKRDIKRFLSNNGFKYNDEVFKPGDWFEEFIFYLFKETYRLDDLHIKMSLKLFPSKEVKIDHSNFDNEIDVAFMLDNILYTYEAKVSIGKSKPNITSITNTLYKISAVNKGFGLKPQSALITLSDFKKLDPKTLVNFERRCRVIGINDPVDRTATVKLYNELKK